jgi:hypothetical protein
MIVAALDPASTKNACALAVLGRSRSGVWLPLHLREWVPSPGAPLDLRLHVLPEAAADLRALGGTSWATDAHAPAEVRIVSTEHGIGATFATSDVREHWRHLAAVLARRQLSLAPTGHTRTHGPAWPDAEALRELREQIGRVRREYVGDAWRVTIPEIGGLHGDLAVAVARALWLARAADADFAPTVKVDVNRLGGRSRYDTGRREDPARSFRGARIR